MQNSSATQTAETDTGAADQAPLTLDFQPVFDCRHGVVNTYYACPILRGPQRSMSDEDVLVLGTEGRSLSLGLVQRLMTGIVGGALEKAAALTAEGAGHKVVVPINGWALTHREVASTFTDLCRRYRGDVHQSVIFEITNMTNENRLSHLDDIAIILYPFCLTYTARILPKTQDLKHYAACNYTGISLYLKNKPWPMAALGTYFSDLVRRTEANRLKAYCHGLGSVELTGAAREAGVRFLSGSGVSEWLHLTGVAA